MEGVLLPQCSDTPVLSITLSPRKVGGIPALTCSLLVEK